MNITPPERDQLLAANGQWTEVSLACTRQPTVCDLAALDRVSAGSLKDRMLQLVGQWAAAGEDSIPNPEHPTYYVVTDVIVGLSHKRCNWFCSVE